MWYHIETETWDVKNSFLSVFIVKICRSCNTNILVISEKRAADTCLMENAQISDKKNSL